MFVLYHIPTLIHSSPFRQSSALYPLWPDLHYNNCFYAVVMILLLVLRYWLH